MRDSISAFLEHCQTLRYSAKSVKSYEGRLHLFRVFAYDHGTKRIREVSISLVRAFHGRLLEKGLKSSSIDCYMTTVRTYLKWCFEHRLVLSDLSSRIELPKPAKALPPQPLTQDDIEKLFRSVPAVGIQNVRNRAILEILYACGLRKQELIDLNLGDVDFTKGIVHVRGKGDKERLVPIHERALKAISAYLVERGGKPNRKIPLLLTHSHNCKEPHRLTERSLEMVFRKLNQQFPKHLHPHLLRHTFSLHLLQNGVDLRYVQLLLGHENPDTTSRYLGYCKKEIKAQYDQGIDWILAAE